MSYADMVSKAIDDCIHKSSMSTTEEPFPKFPDLLSRKRLRDYGRLQVVSEKTAIWRNILDLSGAVPRFNLDSEQDWDPSKVAKNASARISCLDRIAMTPHLMDILMPRARGNSSMNAADPQAIITELTKMALFTKDSEAATVESLRNLTSRMNSVLPPNARNGGLLSDYFNPPPPQHRSPLGTTDEVHDLCTAFTNTYGACYVSSRLPVPRDDKQTKAITQAMSGIQEAASRLVSSCCIPLSVSTNNPKGMQQYVTFMAREKRKGDNMTHRIIAAATDQHANYPDLSDFMTASECAVWRGHTDQSQESGTRN